MASRPFKFDTDPPRGLTSLTSLCIGRSSKANMRYCIGDCYIYFRINLCVSHRAVGLPAGVIKPPITQFNCGCHYDPKCISSAPHFCIIDTFAHFELVSYETYFARTVTSCPNVGCMIVTVASFSSDFKEMKHVPAWTQVEKRATSCSFDMYIYFSLIVSMRSKAPFDILNARAFKRFGVKKHYTIS